MKIAARKTTATGWSTRRSRRAALLALDDQAMELVALGAVPKTVVSQFEISAYSISPQRELPHAR
jgi:hypothetical protein